MANAPAALLSAAASPPALLLSLASFRSGPTPGPPLPELASAHARVRRPEQNSSCRPTRSTLVSLLHAAGCLCQHRRRPLLQVLCSPPPPPALHARLLPETTSNTAIDHLRDHHQVPRRR
ncbi:hypothetical protein VPH35_040594 [Triticum aestivum]